MNDTAKDQAQAQYETIVSMLETLDLDWTRLEDLRSFDPEDMTPEDIRELAHLDALADGCEDHDAAYDRIQEDPLEITVRSDWTAPGQTLEANEFCILLCTGGPAVRIVGELDRGQPVRAWIEYQDWGTPWTQYFGADQDVLIRYASMFYFGE